MFHVNLSQIASVHKPDPSPCQWTFKTYLNVEYVKKTSQQLSRNWKSNLDESPSDAANATTAKITQKLLEHSWTDIDVIFSAAHALVGDSDLDRVALGLNANLAPAQGISVGLSAHLDVRERNNHRVIIVGPTTGPKGRVEEGDVTCEGSRAGILAASNIPVPVE